MSLPSGSGIEVGREVLPPSSPRGGHPGSSCLEPAKSHANQDTLSNLTLVPDPKDRDSTHHCILGC